MKGEDVEEERRANVAQLLRRAADEHHAYEQATMEEGHSDPNWPEWYAQWMLDHGLTEMLIGEPCADPVVV